MHTYPGNCSTQQYKYLPPIPSTSPLAVSTNSTQPANTFTFPRPRLPETKNNAHKPKLEPKPHHIPNHVFKFLFLNLPPHLNNLSMSDLEKRRDAQIAGHNRLLQAIYDDYPEYEFHVQNNMPIRAMTTTRSRLLAQSSAVQKELRVVQKEIARRKKH